MHLLSPFSLNLPLYEHKKRPSYIVLFLGPLGRMAISAKSVHLFKYCINK